MKVIDIVSTANHNLGRSKLRTFLTVLAISIGAFTLALSLGLGEGVKGYIASQLGDYKDANIYIVQKEGGQFGANPFSAQEPVTYDPNAEQEITNPTAALFTEQDAADLEINKTVQSATLPYAPTFLYFENSNGDRYEARADLFVKEFPVTTLAGEPFNEDELNKTMISRKFVEAVGANSQEDAIGKQVTFVYEDNQGNMQSDVLIVSGVFEPALGDLPFKISEPYARQVMENQKTTPELLFGVIFASRNLEFSEEDFKAELADQDLQAISIAEFNEFVNNIITGVQIALGIFSGIAILASVVGVVNTLFMAVLERTKEIGLYRALGAKRKTIFALFSVEAALIGFWGALLGTGLSFAGQLIINSIASATFLSGVDGLKLLSITPELIVIILITIAIITFISGIVPAIKASKLKPIDALRYE